MNEPLATPCVAYPICMAAYAAPASWGRRRGERGRGGGVPLLLEITLRAPGGEKMLTLPWASFGRILIFFNDFYSVEKRVTRPREWR